jgi:acyl dehydratase
MTAFDPTTDDAIPPMVAPALTRTGFVRYQGASGDFNPIHHDDEFARAAGYPSVFSVGMLAAGVLGTYLMEVFEPHRVSHFRVQFRQQAWPDDVLTYQGSVVERRVEESDRQLSVTLPDGSPHLVAWMTAAHVPPPAPVPT